MKYTIKVSPLSKPRQWVVLEESLYEDLKVPAGFEFDGASIPVGFRWLFPHGGCKFYPACIHDYLYRTGIKTREESDRIFYKLMLENGEKPWKAKLMYLAVKWFGWTSWNQRRNQQQLQELL